MDYMPPTEALARLSLGVRAFLGVFEYELAPTTALRPSSASLSEPLTHFALPNVLPLPSIHNRYPGSIQLPFADPGLPESETSAPPRARQEDQSRRGRVHKRDRRPLVGEYKANPTRPKRTKVFKRERKRVETPKRRRYKDDEKRAAVYRRRFQPCLSNCKTRKKAALYLPTSPALPTGCHSEPDFRHAIRVGVRSQPGPINSRYKSNRAPDDSVW